jgi:2-methylcitrate dehydratase PrpD
MKPGGGEIESLTRALCEALAGWRYDDLPADVVRMTKLLVLDTLGVISGATNAPGVRELNVRLSRWERGGSATGLVGMRRYSPPSAALANGAAAHALDFDDQHDPARAHTSCVMLPTLLATAEDAPPVSSRSFLLAFAMGAELQARLGVACSHSLQTGWHPTMTFGTLAAGAAAAHMLGLDAAGIRNALGLAFHQASGSAQSMRDGVLSKRLGPGFAARAAVMSAFLAADGLTGTQRTLEGNAGLFALYERGHVQADLVLRGLREEWYIRDYSFKPWPCCRCNHTTIGIALELHAQGVPSDEVERAQIRLGHANFMTVGGAYDPQRRSVVHAQFNAAYSFAQALVNGRVDLKSYDETALTHTAVAALAARTAVVHDITIDPTSQEAHVIVRLRDGSSYERRRVVMKGSPGEPMSEAELLGKLESCMDFGGRRCARADAERLAGAVLTLERAADVTGALLDAYCPREHLG